MRRRDDEAIGGTDETAELEKKVTLASSKSPPSLYYSGLSDPRPPRCANARLAPVHNDECFDRFGVLAAVDYTTLCLVWYCSVLCMSRCLQKPSRPVHTWMSQPWKGNKQIVVSSGAGSGVLEQVSCAGRVMYVRSNLKRNGLNGRKGWWLWSKFY